MEILDEQPTEKASQMEYQSNNESLHFEESSNNKNVNDKSDVFQINTGMFDLKGKNLPPKLAEIKQHFKITDINNEQ